MTGVIVDFDPQTGTGAVRVRGRSGSGVRRLFRFAATDVRRGVPARGARVDVAICWPSTGQPFATDLRVLDSVTGGNRG